MAVDWLQVLANIAWIVFGFLAVYFKTRTDVVSMANSVISKAEEIYKESGSGGKRMKWAVQYIHSVIPTPLKFIFTESFIESILQTAFDGMQNFAKKQLDKVIDNIVTEEQ